MKRSIEKQKKIEKKKPQKQSTKTGYVRETKENPAEIFT